MSKKEKLIARLKSKPRDFTWDEAVTLMKYYEFVVINNKGSRRKFYNEKTKQIFSFHKPHPQNVLKPYLIEMILKELKL